MVIKNYLQNEQALSWSSMRTLCLGALRSNRRDRHKLRYNDTPVSAYISLNLNPVILLKYNPTKS